MYWKKMQHTSGQKNTPIRRGKAGSRAEPNCSLQAILPVSFTARLATVPRKMPKAVHNCHVMTRAPRIEAGAFSAAKIGTVAPLHPIPMPRRRRVMKSCSHAGLCQIWSLPYSLGNSLCETADPIGDRAQKMADTKMQPRRPR